MHFIALGIIVAILLFKIYPTKGGNEVKKRIVQAIISIGLLIGIIISFMFMKFVLGIILGLVGLFLAFQKRKKQLDGVLGFASMLSKFSPSKNEEDEKKP